MVVVEVGCCSLLLNEAGRAIVGRRFIVGPTWVEGYAYAFTLSALSADVADYHIEYLLNVSIRWFGVVVTMSIICMHEVLGSIPGIVIFYSLYLN
jgi:hypothetical protein